MGLFIVAQDFLKTAGINISLLWINASDVGGVCFGLSETAGLIPR